jgi:arylsulfatase A-like enzyme
MDTARARNALPSANPGTVPRLAEVASEGVEFTAAMSAAPWTLPSHASMFTGRYASDHGTHAGDKEFAPEHGSLAERLQAIGYTTVAFSNNSWVSPEFGFDRGFDRFYEGWRLFDVDCDLTRVMREIDSPLAQLRELFMSTEPAGIPATLVNAAYAKFFRKRYDYGAFATNWRIGRWLDRRSTDEPFFLFVNYLEPHLEYDPPRRYCTHLPEYVSVAEARRVEQDAWQYVGGGLSMSDREFEILEGLYDSELAYLDHRIGELLDEFSSRGLLEETVVVLVGDHGENIGDHGLMDHQYCLYDTLIHVPLIIRGVDEFRGGERVTDVVETRALLATILETVGFDTSTLDSSIAVSLSDTVDPASDELDRRRGAVAEYLVPQPSVEVLRERAGDVEDARLDRFDRALRAIRTANWKLVESSDGGRELYDIADDPRESTNCATERPDIAAELQARLHDERGPLRRGERDDQTVEVGARQRLEDLGYI